MKLFSFGVVIFFVITALILGFVLGIYAALTFIVSKAEKENKKHRRDEINGGK